MAVFPAGDAYWKSTALIMVGSILGVLFISLVRRVMVEDPELPFPESVAASEIHKAGRRGADAAKYLFWNIGVGGVVLCWDASACSPPTRIFIFASAVWDAARSTSGHWKYKCPGNGRHEQISAPSVSPAYLGVGYIIGIKLASLQFAGSVLAWGLMVPLLMYFIGPQLRQYIPADTPDNWAAIAGAVGDLSFAPSLSAACWWARLIHCSTCGKV